MQETERNDVWVRCPYCRHKLFKKLLRGDGGLAVIEIKCSSCKKIITLEVSYGEKD